CARRVRERIAIPLPRQLFDVVPDQQRPARGTQVVYFSRFESLARPAALQISDSGLSLHFSSHQDNTSLEKPRKTGSGQSSMPNRSRTRARICRARRTTSSALASPLFTRARVCFVDNPAEPVE